MSRTSSIPGPKRRLSVDVSERFWKRMDASGLPQAEYLERLLGGIDSGTQVAREAKEREIEAFEREVQVRRAELQAALAVLQKQEAAERDAKQNWHKEPVKASA